ncbi:MAG: reverse transcriptase/maturase family protein [Planctomycetia bacterium]
MKRAGNLFPSILAYDNLRLAAAKALRGKRNRPDARAFVADLDGNLTRLRDDLNAGNVAVGEATTFEIRDPKKRTITAPCFRERVLHHAVMNVCEPWLERRLIDDTYACRKGRGRLAALARAIHFSNRSAFAAKLDVRKYFDSIPHNRLLLLVERVFKDHRLLDLLRRIVAAYAVEPGRGLPIGSLTSQHLANLYLDPVDRFVKETLRVKGYARYMDDLAFWGGRPAELKAALRETTAFTFEKLGLSLRISAGARPVRMGLPFLGVRVFPHRVVPDRRSRRRYAAKLRDVERTATTETERQQRETALTAFLTTPGMRCWRFRSRTLHRSSAASQGPEPREPRR